MARGSRRGGRGGRNPRDLPRSQQISRQLSWLLRHGAVREGLKLGKGGYVSLQDAVSVTFLFPLWSYVRSWGHVQSERVEI